jgi:hypothetical protein
VTQPLSTPESILRSIQRALGRARSSEYRARTWQMGRNHWRVASQTVKGKSYDVTVYRYGYCYGVHPAYLNCSCKSWGPCKHAAKVALRLAREARAGAGGRKRAPRVVVTYTARPRVVATVGGELFDEAVEAAPRVRVTLEELYG